MQNYKQFLADNKEQSFDYIFLGAGCATLSIVARMQDDIFFANKKILLIEKDLKNTNDRTWSFWENKENYFENIVEKKWNKLKFVDNHNSEKILDNENYQYKTIRSKKFYEYCFAKIDKNKNIFLLNGLVKDYNHQQIKVDQNTIEVKNATCFNSLYAKPNLKPNQFYFLQHFKGWIINTSTNFFDESIATLMDFSVAQNKGTAFVYVLPFSAKQAMIEYTMFTPKILDDIEYEAELKNYVEIKLGIENYTIVEREFGIIPMTNFKFPIQEKNFYQIGTAGGHTKASTGYTFVNIQNQAETIISNLKNEKKPIKKKTFFSKRFDWYDSTLLNVLNSSNIAGAEIFSRLFAKNKASQILKFLDNKTNFFEELKIMNSTQRIIFSKAALKEMFKNIF